MKNRFILIWMLFISPIALADKYGIQEAIDDGQLPTGKYWYLPVLILGVVYGLVWFLSREGSGHRSQGRTSRQASKSPAKPDAVQVDFTSPDDMDKHENLLKRLEAEVRQQDR